MASVTLVGVRNRFANGFEAIRGVDLEIADGEFMVLVGPSGCGKTTLLRAIAGLEPVTEGTILIGDRDVTDAPPGERDIAMVFQSYALYPHMDVEANLGFGLRRRRTPGQVVRDRVERIARALALGGLLERRPGMLSGGQRQRVAIGRAMVREPVAYLMDEPLSNLDAKLRVSMRAELARLHDRLGVTTIYVTHDQVEAMTLGDRVCVLHEGEILQVDTPDRLFNAPANTLVASFIGSPAMNLAVADVEAGGLRFGQHHIEVTADLRHRIAERERVVIGLRPSDFRLRASDLSGDDGRPSRVIRLPAVAEVVERLGSEQLVVFPVDVPRYQVGQVASTAADDDTLLSDPDTSRFTARLDMRRPIARGEHVDLWFDLDRLYLFDEATGLALEDDAQGSSEASARSEQAVV